MRVFIIRPFGTKENINFEEVEEKLIQPALAQLGGSDMQVSGSTTGLITAQGNIREDMFRLIAVADLVIADISIHNDNVFYELGMRHALKPRHTFMIRSKTDARHPFDLLTDRYFSYDAANPMAGVTDLVRALRSTLASVHADSPMFKLLPALRPHGRGQLVSVPSDFCEDVERARVGRQFGKLRLFAEEVGAFEWDQEGLRLIGDAQFKLRHFAGARDTFELLRQTDGAHVQANLKLGTIYQRLTLLEPAAHKADLMNSSTQAIKRVIDASPAKIDLVEAHCLLASNEKSRWVDELSGMTPVQQQSVTLSSVHFDRMLKAYLLAANLDLNAHYPAINGLAALKIKFACAQALPDEWQQLHDSPASAAAALTATEKLIGHLSSTLHLALELDELMGKRPGEPDPWADSSRADFLLLTACQATARVRQRYKDVLTGDDWFALEATRRNLDIYKRLGLFEPGVSAALGEIDAAMAAGGKPAVKPAKVLIFTGHMVDAAGKPEAQWRFPRTGEAMARARALIRHAVQLEVSHCQGKLLGIAGGACGGDILFHEVCAELGVPTMLYLALPVKQFEVTSVQHGGPDWVERYRALVGRLTPQVLQSSERLPGWLVNKREYNVWERNNLWMMFSAISTGADDLSLIALYNPEREPGGPGGTAHLLAEAKKKGFKAVELDARELLAK
jgi:hypothetical protein